ncbi:MAG: hypothetical protein BGO72_05440 [Burkholderiales bacterium 70-64]|nr:MAG: hypothetical protein BGO72_05440 [Burkholderiales bacterium 70-64]
MEKFRRAVTQESALAQTGIKSIEVGGRLLKVLAKMSVPLALKDLAAHAGLTASAAHRYLVSYQRLGLVRQDRTTLAYEIGPFAIELGLVAIGRSNFLDAAQDLQQRVRDRLDESVMLAVWGSYGPVIISIEESSKAIALTMRVGATLPLLRTASGLIFAAHMPRAIVTPVIRAEYAAGRPPVERLDRRDLDLKLEAIRKASLANHSGHLLPGVAAVAAPMLNSRGQIVAAMSVFGNSETFDYSLEGPAAMVLREVAADFTSITRRIGQR